MDAHRLRHASVLSHERGVLRVALEGGEQLSRMVTGSDHGLTSSSAVRSYSVAEPNRMLRTSQRFVWHPKDAALTQVYAAVSDDIRKGGVTGKYFHPIARLNEKPDPHTFNKTLQHRLWELSVDITQTK